jgi:hypothetical protein
MTSRSSNLDLAWPVNGTKREMKQASRLQGVSVGYSPGDVVDPVRFLLESMRGGEGRRSVERTNTLNTHSMLDRVRVLLADVSHPTLQTLRMILV